MTYRDEIVKAMEMLGKDERTLFLGQTVEYPGSQIHSTLEKIANEKKIEVPIMEDVQMGMSIGLSLNGYIPISVYPRFDFLLCATNQLVNHLDKIKELSHGEYNPKVIIRTAVGAKKPLYPGLQHCSDYTEAFKTMLKNVDVVKLEDSKQILPAYRKALEGDRSTLLIEISDKYNTD